MDTSLSSDRHRYDRRGRGNRGRSRHRHHPYRRDDYGGGRHNHRRDDHRRGGGYRGRGNNNRREARPGNRFSTETKSVDPQYAMMKQLTAMVAKMGDLGGAADVAGAGNEGSVDLSFSFAEFSFT